MFNLIKKGNLTGFKTVNGMTFGVYVNKKRVILAGEPSSRGTTKQILEHMKFDKIFENGSKQRKKKKA